MSLETEVAALTAVNNKLVDTVNGKMAGINSAVAAAVAAAPSMTRVYWVDSQLGNDTEGLGSSASPFKTIQRAVDATPDGGRVQVWLAKDYVLDKHIILNGRKLILAGEVGAGRKLTLNEFVQDSETLIRMGSFWLSSQSTLEFANMTISLPSSAAGDLSAYYALAFSSGSSAPINMQMRLYNCTFELRGTYRGRIFGAGSVLFTLALVGTALPSALNGLIVPGVSAGTLAKDIPYVMTNLTSL